MDIEFDDDEIQEYSQRIIAEAEMYNRMALTQASLLVQNKGKELSPYDTGNLRRSIHHTLRNDKGKVGSDVEYARVREYHTQGLPNGYLRQGLSDSQQAIKELFERVFNRFFN